MTSTTSSQGRETSSHANPPSPPSPSSVASASSSVRGQRKLRQQVLAQARAASSTMTQRGGLDKQRAAQPTSLGARLNLASRERAVGREDPQPQQRLAPPPRRRTLRLHGAHASSRVFGGLRRASEDMASPSTSSEGVPLDKERLTYRSSPIKRVAALFEKRGAAMPHAFLRTSASSPMGASPRKSSAASAAAAAATATGEGTTSGAVGGRRKRAGQHRIASSGMVLDPRAPQAGVASERSLWKRTGSFRLTKTRRDLGNAAAKEAAAAEADEDLAPLPMPEVASPTSSLASTRLAPSPQNRRTGRKELLLDQRRRHLQLLQAKQQQAPEGDGAAPSSTRTRAKHNLLRLRQQAPQNLRASTGNLYASDHSSRASGRYSTGLGGGTSGRSRSKDRGALTEDVAGSSLVQELKDELVRARKAIQVATQANASEKDKVTHLESTIEELKALNTQASEERRKQAEELAELRSSMFDLRASVMDFRPTEAMPSEAEMSLRYSHLDIPREAPSPEPLVADELLYTNKQRAKFATDGSLADEEGQHAMFEASNWSEKPSSIQEESYHEDDDMDFSFLRMESARLRFPDGEPPLDEEEAVSVDEQGVVTFSFGAGPMGITFHGKRSGGFVITGCEGVAAQKGVRVGDAIVEINRQRLPEDMLDDELYDMLVELPRPISIGFVRLGDHSFRRHEERNPTMPTPEETAMDEEGGPQFSEGASGSLDGSEEGAYSIDQIVEEE